MYQLTWINAHGKLFAVTSPQRNTLWHLREELHRGGAVKARLWGKKGELL